nr:MAG: capsid protein [Cressdnaviricota sp.]
MASLAINLVKKLVKALKGKSITHASQAKKPGFRSAGKHIPFAGKQLRVAPGRKKSKVRVQNNGVGGQKLTFSHGKRAKKLPHKKEVQIREALQVSDTQIFTVPYQQTSAQNQCSYYAYEIGNVADIDTIISNLNAAGAQENVEYNGKVLIKDANMMLKCINATNVSLQLRIYEYIARRDLPESLYVSTNALIQGGFAVGNVTHQSTPTLLDGTIFQNPLFCCYYKITKVQNIILPQGQPLNLSLHINKEKILNPLVWNASTEEITEQHYTRGIIIQMTGQTGDASGVVGYTSGYLDVLQSNTYHFREGFDAYGRIWSASATLGTVANVLNPATGASIAVAEV